MPDGTYQPKVYRKNGGNTQVVASGGDVAVQSGGVVNYESGAQLKIAGSDRTAVLATAPAAVAAGYKIARGVTSVNGTAAVTSGLATVVAVTVTLAADPVVGEAMWTTVSIPTQTGGDAGKFTIKTWKPTAVNDATPAAGSVAKDVAWVAVGT